MKTAKFLALASVAVLASCTQDEMVKNVDNSRTGKTPMSFSLSTPNMTRATALNEMGVTTFGVYAQKNVGGNYQQVMGNYMVKYCTTEAGTTWNDANSLTDNKSMWVYEGLKPADGAAADQYLKYWDYSSSQVEFFAFVANGGYSTDAASYTSGADGKLTLSNIWAGFTKPVTLGGVTYPAVTDGTSLLAQKTVAKNDYGVDVPLSFKRINGEVRAAFYEVIDGYTVEITRINVQAKDVDGTDYVDGQIYVGCSATIDNTATITTTAGLKKYVETPYTVPAGENDAVSGNHHAIGVDRAHASVSEDVYYCVPCGYVAPGEYQNSGFLVTLDFKLYSVDTDETIEVKGAKVYVAPQYTQWASNTKYTYVFKITKYTGGTTGDDDDPEGLKPIVFDGIEVETMADMDDAAKLTWVVNTENATDPNPITE